MTVDELMATLLIRNPRGETRRVTLRHDVFTIGRASENDLQIEDPRVSRYHGELRRSGSAYHLRDLGSRNAVFVNGAQTREHALQPGDEIEIGGTVLVYEPLPGSGSGGASEERLDLGSSITSLLGKPATAEEALRARERFAALYQVGRRLSASSLAELEDLALAVTFDSVRAERAALLLRDPATNEMTLRRSRHRHGQALRESELPVPRSIVREAVSNRVGILTSDAVRDQRFEAQASVQIAQVRSALCVPLWEDDEILGVLYLDSRARTYAFTREDLVLANALANLIGIRFKQEALNEKLAEERVLRANLERYHSPDVASAILERARQGGDSGLGLEERDVTIAFADVTGFTALAERAELSAVADFLNDYYGIATRAIFDHGGTVNEYVGDSVMAIFGAPLPQDDHALRAVRAAVQLLDEVRRRRLAFGSEVRIALNSGRVLAGSVGSVSRLKYAVLGDPVNVAARLEKFGEPGTITLSESTALGLGSEFACEDLGLQALRGRDQPVRVFRLRPR